ncbi:MAG: DNA repair protein RecN [Clostridia bacterium]|nr:DNA repair protein RecN [Clostridia bacterium]
MLKNLIINNFALIKDLEIEFGNQLNVISGETGSGKSLIMKALKFVLGDRADKSFVRNGEQYTKVQCVFDSINENVRVVCNELGIEVGCDEPLIISRTLTIDGKGDIRINGNISTLTNLNKITKLIVDFYGQQEHYSLLETSKQLDIVDNFKLDNIRELKGRLSTLIEAKKDIELKLKQNFGDDKDKQLKIELLEYEINELENNQFNDDYEDDLREKKTKYQSIEKIKAGLDSVKNILGYGYSNSSLANAFKDICTELKMVERYENDATKLIEQSESLRYEVEDLEFKIERLDNSLFNEDLNIDEIEQELEKVKSIKRKYGQRESDRLDYLENSKMELDFILNNEKVVKEYTAKLDAVKADIFKVCNNLYKEREISKVEIEKGLVQNLKDLEMKNAQFKISHNYNENLENLTVNGLDTIEFMFSSNLGQPLKPLSKIISGGELSRFMLAYKNVIMLKDDIDLLIFDEIDSGISGVVGQKVANKICDISRNCQVISISHLPQIVSMADNNLLVFKESKNNETCTSCKVINENDLLKEIARLSGSKEIKDLDLKYASELKAYSNNYKLRKDK